MKKYVFSIIILVALAIMTAINVSVYFSKNKVVPVVSTVITDKFGSYIKSIKQQNHLSVARLETTEIIERQYDTTIELPNWSFLKKLSNENKIQSTAKVEIICPTTFTYYVDLADEKWKVQQVGDTVIVHCPDIKASKPAVHFSGLHSYINGGYLVFDEEKKRDQLMKNLDVILAKRAEQHIQIVKETCRSGIKKFVKSWLLKDDFPADNIKILIGDEK
ncbi:MAG: DUF4230 domain-containing protein [Lentisphaeria bacterium]|nr:DUF4230 domain-containing protein [Lentisphaeria bacterium]NQZ70753.1 DUF4230 domain-containing protein [Lentisphaeria bacterium]